MNETEAKMRCLELAAQINRASGEHCVDAIVISATALYNFIQASPQDKNPVEFADKSKRRKPMANATDILS